MYRKILVPVDGSPHSDYTVSQAMALAKSWGPGVHLTLLHVVSYSVIADSTVVVDLNRLLQEESKNILARAQSILGDEPGISHDVLSQTGDPAAVICETITSGGYDLTVIGNRGGGVFSELLMGSVSHKVIQHASCPVLVVRVSEANR